MNVVDDSAILQAMWEKEEADIEAPWEFQKDLSIEERGMELRMQLRYRDDQVVSLKRGMAIFNASWMMWKQMTNEHKELDEMKSRHAQQIEQLNQKTDNMHLYVRKARRKALLYYRPTILLSAVVFPYL